MRQITVLAAAAGTALSEITQALGEKTGIFCVDLENVILDEVIDWGAFGHPAPAMRNMGTVCSQATRSEVIEYWQSAFDLSIERLLSQPLSEALVLSTHINLFSASRLEFYSTPITRRFDRKNEIVVSQVVVLIDDIYDMHARLSGHGNMYGNPDLALREHEAHSIKLTDYVFEDPADRARHNEQVVDFTDADRATLSIELRAKDLLRLLLWRRFEMLSGEELARNLGCRYTAFGVKHEFDSLVRLIADSTAKTVYISHKITEPRVENIRADMDGNPNHWPELVADVNGLSAKLRDVGLVAIQPTAVDELRFLKNVGNSDRLLRYSGHLAARWPIVQGAANVVASGDSPRYENLLDLNRQDHDSYRHGVFGLVQHQIYDEISFRDHQLVSSNEALVVYRPTAMGSYVSGGVEKEVGHWARSLQHPDIRPAVFIHVLSELVEALSVGARGARQSQTRWAARTALVKNLSSFLGETQAGQLWISCVEQDEDLPEFLPKLSMHLGRVDAQTEARIGVALDQTATALVSTSCTIPASALSKAAHFTFASLSRGIPSATLRDIASLIDHPKADSFDEFNERLLDDLLTAFGLATSLQLVRRLCGFDGPSSPFE